VGNGEMIGSRKSSGFAMPKYKLNWRQRGPIARDLLLGRADEVIE
jgi:hypothetical protein